MGAPGAPEAPGSKLLEAHYIKRLEVPLESPGSTHIRNLLATRTYYLPYLTIYPCV
jgi:hypothetical protein